ncbi:hypothetical protein FACS189420_5970 [Bacteroidia bacterium]|nr:hypothetical protein FACS189420_5970 [Bacteroidia bacterium]
MESESRDSADFTFMEVFKAETLKDGKPLNAVNILKNKELLYPVSFAVRKEDTVLIVEFAILLCRNNK